MKEVLQGSALFNIFINDLEEVTECLPTRFSGDTKLEGTIDTLKGRANIQSGLEAEGMVHWEPIIQEEQMLSTSSGKGEFLAVGHTGTDLRKRPRELVSRS